MTSIIKSLFLIFCVIFGIKGKMKRMTGVHLKIAVYHVSYRTQIIIIHKQKKLINLYFLSFSGKIKRKEPPIFYIRRDPNNASAVNYSGAPKDIFDLLAASLNFT